jgi:hydrogenase 3 maturation protease
MNLNNLIKDILKDTKRLVILGVGAELKADDALGIIIAGKLKKKLDNKKFENLKIYIGNTAPENFTGEIKNFKPDHLLVIDACDLNQEPGCVMLIDPDVINGISFSTHMLPLKIMLEYLKKEIEFKISIFGVQVSNLDYDGKISSAIKKTINEVTSVLLKEVPRVITA